jgi:PBP1b-binding outer membrane lipoprotein LpoB
MKKLLLLSALLIFACTDVDTSNEENTNPSNEKLIESVTFSSVQTCLDFSDFSSANTTNCTYNSDNLITSFKNQFYELTRFDFVPASFAVSLLNGICYSMLV